MDTLHFKDFFARCLAVN
uniref:Uncharacterized protein n=1 Tax=Anguilla anguilla TaxID=7936 RepID=A0A0E9V685_ANGAN